MSIKLTKTLEFIKELPTQLSSIRENGEEGAWFWATKEVKDSCGDIVRVDGIDLKPYHNPPDTRLKVLAQHMKALPDGRAPVVGVVGDWVKTLTFVDGKQVPALALYVTYLWKEIDLINAEGTCIKSRERLPLSQHYYDLLNSKPYPGIDSGSVGLIVSQFHGKPTKDGGDGLDVTESTIYEFSLVSVPAHAGANQIKELEKSLEVTIDRDLSPAASTGDEDTDVVTDDDDADDTISDEKDKSMDDLTCSNPECKCITCKNFKKGDTQPALAPADNDGPGGVASVPAPGNPPNVSPTDTILSSMGGDNTSGGNVGGGTGMVPYDKNLDKNLPNNSNTSTGKVSNGEPMKIELSADALKPLFADLSGILKTMNQRLELMESALVVLADGSTNSDPSQNHPNDPAKQNQTLDKELDPVKLAELNEMMSKLKSFLQ